MNDFLRKTENSTITIHKAKPTFHFDKELDQAMIQYDQLLKELINR